MLIHTHIYTFKPLWTDLVNSVYVVGLWHGHHCHHLCTAILATILMGAFICSLYLAFFPQVHIE